MNEQPSTAERAQALLAEQAAYVDEALDRLMPPADAPPAPVHEAMRYSVFAGGKRLRPALVLSACRAAGSSEADALGVACGVELIHTYSLIHDDLPAMDDDDWRRGQPSCHKKFGEAVAILAGDALQTLAFQVIVEQMSRPEAACRVLSELTRAVGSRGMVGGQVLDLAAGQSPRPPTVEQVEAIHRSKTSALIAASVRCGAICAGAAKPVLDSFGRFGENIGLAFQIADDVLDVTGSKAALGKATGKDQAQGKATYPAAAGLEASRRRARELLTAAANELNGLGPAAAPLLDLARFIIERDH